MALSSIPLPLPRYITLPPLLTSTVILGMATFEYLSFNGFVKVSLYDRSAAARTISLWWKHTIREGLLLICSVGFSGVVSGVRLARRLPSVSGAGSSRWSREKFVAVLGTICLVGHFGFAGLTASVVQEMAFAYERAGVWRVSFDEGVTDSEAAGPRTDSAPKGGIGEGQVVEDPRFKAEIEEQAMEEGRAINDVVNERVIEGQRKWLRLHIWRTLGVDLPAFLCFAWVALRR